MVSAWEGGSAAERHVILTTNYDTLLKDRFTLTSAWLP